jgi:hypothetical protein
LLELVRRRYWHFFCDCGNIRGQYNRGRMNQMYQWLSGRASLFRFGKSGRGAGRNVRTEVTVERESTTLLVGGSAAIFDICPLCGNKLARAQAEQAGLRPHRDSTNSDND